MEKNEVDWYSGSVKIWHNFKTMLYQTKNEKNAIFHFNFSFFFSSPQDLNNYRIESLKKNTVSRVIQYPCQKNQKRTIYQNHLSFRTIRVPWFISLKQFFSWWQFWYLSTKNQVITNPIQKPLNCLHFCLKLRSNIMKIMVKTEKRKYLHIKGNNRSSLVLKRIKPKKPSFFFFSNFLFFICVSNEQLYDSIIDVEQSFMYNSLW